MNRAGIVSWLDVEFEPLILSLTPAAKLQIVENVIRYWNQHSGFALLKMFTTANVISIDAEYKTVVQVLPSSQSTSLALADPTWTLLGIQVMNYLTTDFIALNEAYRNYRGYFGSDFRWHFEMNSDPTLGGKLFIQNAPTGATSVAVVGTKRILAAEDIKAEFILDWVLRGSKAQVKISEGNVLRKASIIGVNNDGQQLLDEGKEEWEALKKELSENGRWVALASRV